MVLFLITFQIPIFIKHIFAGVSEFTSDTCRVTTGHTHEVPHNLRM